MKVADDLRREVLPHETLVAEIGPRALERLDRLAIARDLGEPLAVLLGRLGADALDVAHHGEAERVGIDAGEARIVEVRLEDHARMQMQNSSIAASSICPRSCSLFMIA